jgi:two-component system, LytTR family, response regulator AlgR
MGGQDGLQVARRLAQQKVPPAVIFVTAHAEHALSAFDAAADGYLMKPVRREKLQEALQRASRPSRALNLEKLETAQRPDREFVVATTREGIRRIPVEDILYFLADQKYTTVYHLHGEVLIEESLNALEEDFSRWFLRVHRKALVATRFVTGLERGREGEEEVHRLRLRHVNQLIPVSRRRLPEVRRVLTERDHE